MCVGAFTSRSAGQSSEARSKCRHALDLILARIVYGKRESEIKVDHSSLDPHPHYRDVSTCGNPSAQQ
jgi:hypothetical protein